jgi:uncharacterized protein
MKQQVLVIHGGDAFKTYKEYVDDLKGGTVTIEGLRKKGWKKRLSDKLGKNFDVLTPQMPNDWNARYKEWKIWFEKIVPALNNGVILIGHSLGGIFLAKYLSEETISKNIKATMLVAPPYNTEGEHPLVDFLIKKPLTKFIKQAGTIYIYHSKDDRIVPLSNFNRYKKELPDAITRLFTNKGHFTGETFPEIVNDIKKLANK